VQSTGLITGTKYNWKVSAQNSVGESALSSPALAVIAAKVPDAPTGLALSSSSSTYIEFTWIIPYNGGSALVNFLVYWDQGLGGSFSEVAFTAPNVHLYRQDYSLTAGNSYKFRIYASNAVGTSQASATATFVAASLPSAPGQPHATSVTKTSIELAWDAANGNGSAVTNYRLY